MPGGRTTDVEYTGKSSKTRSMKRWSGKIKKGMW